MKSTPFTRIWRLAVGFFVAPLCSPAILFPQDLDTLRWGDQEFVRAIEAHDRMALDSLLDARFMWIDSNGQRLSRAAVLRDCPTIANPEVAIEARAYGNVAVVRANRGRVKVLRIWVQQSSAWRPVLYQEVTQVEKSQSPGGQTSEECINPCKTMPYQPETESEKEALAS